ncbi:hypothetical protein [Neobacillus muris]|nr:hypothetical protein [Neobacillus muris]
MSSRMEGVTDVLITALPFSIGPLPSPHLPVDILSRFWVNGNERL